MRRILLTCELGGGISYGYRLAALARRLVADGHEIHVATPLQSPVHLAFKGINAFFHRPPALNPTGGEGYAASYAQVLLRSGWSDTDQLTSAIQGWGKGFRKIAPDLILVEFAPTAMLAAQTTTIPVVAIGTGYTLPPLAIPMPFTQGWRVPAEGQLEAVEAEALLAMNTALTRLGSEPLQHVAALFRTQGNIVCGFPELSHYPQQASYPWVGPIYSMSGGVKPAWPPHQGPRVFAYLQASHPHFVPLLKAIAERRLPTILYAANLSQSEFVRIAEDIDPAVLNLVSLHTTPVCMETVLADCDIVVCHGIATLSAALAAGKRVMHLPSHLEQHMVFHRLVTGRLGTGAPRNAKSAWVDAALGALLDDPLYHREATAFATRHATVTPDYAVEVIASRVTAVLAATPVRQRNHWAL